MKAKLVAAALAGGLTFSAAVANANEAACNSLNTAGVFPDTTVRSTTLFAADSKGGLPAFCEISAVITPEPGSTIGVVYRLPENWNGKLYGSGGGGWVGDVAIYGFSNIPTALKRGYATAQTDGGHPIGAPFNSSWAVDATGKADMPKIVDFSHRAIHLMTVVGKKVVESYYGKPQSHAIYQGCSTGGRMGLMEAQRYPQDYDGVIAGAPVYDLRVQTSAVLRGHAYADPASRLTLEQFASLNKASLDACDAKDKLKDGVLMDPLKCDFDPGVLECPADAPSAQGCLTTKQVTALRSSYAGVKMSDGRYASYPFVRGSEAAWPQFGVPTPETPTDSTNGGGLGGLRGPLLGDPNFDTSKFDPDKDTQTVMSSAMAKEYNAGNPDLSAFVNNGGKLLLWHGFNDPGPSAIATTEYYDAVKQTIDPKKLASNVRYYIAPGVEHCGGGPGADSFDLLAAMENWIDKGGAPKQIIATKANSPKSWPLCPYPALPQYKGKGDVNNSKSYACK